MIFPSNGRRRNPLTQLSLSTSNPTLSRPRTQLSLDLEPLSLSLNLSQSLFSDAARARPNPSLPSLSISSSPSLSRSLHLSLDLRRENPISSISLDLRRNPSPELSLYLRREKPISIALSLSRALSQAISDARKRSSISLDLKLSISDASLSPTKPISRALSLSPTRETHLHSSLLISSYLRRKLSPTRALSLLSSSLFSQAHSLQTLSSSLSGDTPTPLQLSLTSSIFSELSPTSSNPVTSLAACLAYNEYQMIGLGIDSFFSVKALSSQAHSLPVFLSLFKMAKDLSLDLELSLSSYLRRKLSPTRALSLLSSSLFSQAHSLRTLSSSLSGDTPTPLQLSLTSSIFSEISPTSSNPEKCLDKGRDVTRCVLGLLSYILSHEHETVPVPLQFAQTVPVPLQLSLLLSHLKLTLSSTLSSPSPALSLILCVLMGLLVTGVLIDDYPMYVLILPLMRHEIGLVLMALSSQADTLKFKMTKDNGLLRRLDTFSNFMPKREEREIGPVIGNKWDTYLDLLQADYTEGDALDAIGLVRYCCRRMLMTHVDLIEKLLNYNTLEKSDAN
ncbi:hypothetical protein DY000_02041541 [Brassica cretica]|uniref:Uncharacterized protein n=1 Tax=Brassica cretica TaxID=69181 RepID=A0ABQ7BML7_BRACR|nr:hypothetical protein DY000_02041541 [Brassica cretica]